MNVVVIAPYGFHRIMCNVLRLWNKKPLFVVAALRGSAFVKKRKNTHTKISSAFELA